MGDYLTNDDLVFPGGKKISFYFHGISEAAEVAAAETLLITESENWLNNLLRGSTVIPAVHAKVKCMQICLEYARYLIQRDNFLGLKYGLVDQAPVSDLYRKEADRLYKQLSFGASADTPAAGAQNVGNGTISAITVDDNYTSTEDWRIIFTGANTYDVLGSNSGYLYSGDITENSGKYPVQEDGERMRDADRSISFTITAGATAFEDYDEFSFKTYAQRTSEKVGKAKITTSHMDVTY